MRPSPRRAWLVLALSIASCSTTLTGRRQLTLIDDDQMSALGVSTFEDLKKQGSVAARPELTRYVSCIADPLVAVAPNASGVTPAGAWEVVVFEDPTPNAFALPGGKVGVHTGMLDVAVTQGQLASVIGHEIAHVLLRHGNERLSQSVVAESLLQAGALAIGQMEPAYRDAVVGGLGVGAQYGVLLPFSRKHESEADLLGQQIMAKAGFDPAEAVQVWRRMASLSAGQQPPEFMSTHPAHESRIADLQRNLPSATEEYEAARRGGRRPSCEPPPRAG